MATAGALGGRWAQLVRTRNLAERWREEHLSVERAAPAAPAEEVLELLLVARPAVLSPEAVAVRPG